MAGGGLLMGFTTYTPVNGLLLEEKRRGEITTDMPGCAIFTHWASECGGEIKWRDVAGN